LARPKCSSTGEVDVYVSTELLADLHEPHLVITPDYVGPERRRRMRATVVDPPAFCSPPRIDRGWFVRLVEIVVVAAATVAVAVPLTLMATQGTTPTHPVPATTAVRSSTGGATVHAAGAARSEAARQARVTRTGRHQAAVTAAAARHTASRTASHTVRAARVDAARSASAARQVQAEARRTARAGQRATRAAARSGRGARA
jgi:hypothetical protein